MSIYDMIANPVVADVGGRFAKGADKSLANTIMQAESARADKRLTLDQAASGRADERLALDQATSKRQDEQLAIAQAEENRKKQQQALQGAIRTVQFAQMQDPKSAKLALSAGAKRASELGFKQVADLLSYGTKLDDKDLPQYYSKLEEVAYKSGILERPVAGTARPSEAIQALEIAKKAYSEQNAGEPMPYADQQAYIDWRKRTTPGEVGQRETQKLIAQEQLKPSIAGKVEGAKAQVKLETEEEINKRKKRGERLAEIETAPALIEAKGEITPMAKKERSKKGLTSAIAKVAQEYNRLNDLNAMVNVDNPTIDNVYAAVRNSGLGQFFGKAIGTEEQSLRSSIETSKGLMISDLRNAAEMGARGIDSERELDFYLKGVSDQTLDYQANLAALYLLDSRYGTGEVAKEIEDIVDKKYLADIRKQGADIRAKELEEKGSAKNTYAEGTVIANDKGEQMIMKDGKWQTYQKASK